MAVFRVMKNQNYTVMSNYHLRDKNLSLKAVGLLSKMLSLSDEWNYSNRGLAEICKEGVDAIGSALRELEQNGYLVRQQLRSGNGRILDTEYIIYEMPQGVTQTNRVIEEPETAEEVVSAPSEQETESAAGNNENVEIPAESEKTTGSDMAVPYTENPYPAMSDTRNTAQLRLFGNKCG